MNLFWLSTENRAMFVLRANSKNTCAGRDPWVSMEQEVSYLE